MLRLGCVGDRSRRSQALPWGRSAFSSPIAAYTLPFNAAAARVFWLIATVAIPAWMAPRATAVAMMARVSLVTVPHSAAGCARP